MDNKNIVQKENDFLIALLNQPDFLYEDFRNMGMSSDNTQLLSEEEYKNTKYVQEHEAFKNEQTGEFDEQKYKDIYKKINLSYNLFANNAQSDEMFRDPQSVLNPFATSGYKIPADFKLKKVNNPFLTSSGTYSLFATTNAKLSLTEAAQANFLRDKDGNITNLTANDLGMFGLMSTTKNYALAEYEEDGTHKDNYGRIVKHSKGDAILDENGSPYYRELGRNESVTGKNLLSSFDIITTDNSFANKFDFLDNDDMELSVVGSILRNSAKLAPLFLGSKVKTVYALGTAAVNFTQSLPQFIKAFEGLLANNEGSKSKVWKAVNAVEGYAKKLKGGTSEYAQRNPFAAENWINMLGDIPLQLQQQKAIAQIPKMVGLESRYIKAGLKAVEEASKKSQPLLREAIESQDPKKLAAVSQTMQLNLAKAMYAGEKSMESYANLSKSLSAFYMALTSAGDGYSEFLEDGYSPRGAAIAYMAQLGGLYSLMRYTDIGQIALQGLGLDDVNAATKSAMKVAAKQFGEAYKNVTPLMEKTFYNSIKNIVSNTLNLTIKNGAQGALYNALGEGVEEVTEEMITDAIATFGNVLNEFGVSGVGKRKYTGEDISTRYIMSFVGGMAGGAINVAIEKLSTELLKNMDPNDKTDLIKYIAVNGLDSYNDLVEAQYKKNKLGLDAVTSVSKSKLNDSGELQVVSAADETDTLAYLVKEAMKKTATSIDMALKLISPVGFDADIEASLTGNQRFNEIVKLGAIDEIINDYTRIVSSYIDAKLGAGEQLTPELEASLQALTNQHNQFINGEYFLNYGEKALFTLDKSLSDAFVPQDIYSYTKLYLDKEYNDLSEDEKKKVLESYEVFKQYEKPKQMTLAFQAFKKLQTSLNTSLQEHLPNYSSNRLRVLEIIGISPHNSLRFLQTLDPQNITQELKQKGLGTNPTIDSMQSLVEKVQQITELGLKLDSMTYNLLTEIKNSFLRVLKSGMENFNLNSDISDIEIGGLNGYSIIDSLIKAYLNNVQKDYLTTKDAMDKATDIANVLLQLHPDISFAKVSEFLASDYFSDESFVQEFETANESRKKEILTDFVYTQLLNQDFVSDGIEVLSTQLDELAQSLYVNPVLELLDKLALSGDVNTKRITEILLKEEMRYKDAKSSSDYVMESEERAAEVEQALDYISLLKLTILAGTNYKKGLDVVGHNFFVNKARKELGATAVEELIELDQEDGVQLINELNLIQEKFEFLKLLSEYNNADKMRTFEKTKLKMFKQLYDNIVEIADFIRKNYHTVGLEPLIEKFLSLANSPESIMLSTTVGSNGVEFSEEQVLQIESTLVGLENSLYDIVKVLRTELNLSDLIKLIFNLTSADKGLITSEKLAELSVNMKGFNKLDKILQFAKIIGHKKSNFIGVMQEVLKQPQFESKAPVYAQEYCADIITAFIESPEVFNTILTVFSEIAEYPTLLNFAFLNGYHGSGKSSTVGAIAAAYCTAIGKTFLATSIEDTLVENLKQALNQTVGLNKIELLTSVFGTQDLSKFSAPDAKDPDQVRLGETSQLDKIIKDDTVKSLPDVIFIDEATFYTSFELQALSYALTKHGKIIVGMGDTLLEGSRYKGAPNNLELLLKALTPTLEFSLRADNIHTRDNNVAIRALAYRATLKFLTHSAYDTYLSDLSSIKLKYNLKGTQFTGTKVISTDSNIEAEFKTLLESANGDYSKIMLIYDSEDSPVYKTLSKYLTNGLVLRQSTKMQGLESEYAIIDSDLSYKNDAYTHSRKLNTILSRSRQGNIVIDRSNTLKSEAIDYSGQTLLPLESIKQARDTRFSTYSEILKDYPASKSIVLNLLNNKQPSTPNVPPKSNQPTVSTAQINPDTLADHEEDMQDAPDSLEPLQTGYIPSRTGLPNSGGVAIDTITDTEGNEVNLLTKSPSGNRDINFLIKEGEVIMYGVTPNNLSLMEQDGDEELARIASATRAFNARLVTFNKLKLALLENNPIAEKLLRLILEDDTISLNDAVFNIVYEPYDPAIHNVPTTTLNLEKGAPYGTIQMLIKTSTGEDVIFTLSSIFEANALSATLLPAELTVKKLLNTYKYPILYNDVPKLITPEGYSVQGIYEINRSKLSSFVKANASSLPANILDLSNNEVVRILRIFARSIKKSSKQILLNAGVNINKKTLDELQADPTLQFSPVYIKTTVGLGQNHNINKNIKKEMSQPGFFLDESVKGKPVIFVSNRDFIDPVTKQVVTPDKYKEYYENYRLQLAGKLPGDAYKPYVSMHVLGQKGLSFTEFFEIYGTLLTEIKDAKSQVRVLNSYAGPAFTWRLLNSIFNYYSYNSVRKSPANQNIAKALLPLINGLENVLGLTYEYDKSKKTYVIKYRDEELILNEDGVLVDVNGVEIDIDTSNFETLEIYQDLFAKGNVSYYKILLLIHDIITADETTRFFEKNAIDVDKKSGLLLLLTLEKMASVQTSANPNIGFPNGIFIMPTFVKGEYDSNQPFLPMESSNGLLDTLSLEWELLSQRYHINSDIFGKVVNKKPLQEVNPMQSKIDVLASNFPGFASKAITEDGIREDFKKFMAANLKPDHFYFNFQLNDELTNFKILPLDLTKLPISGKFVKYLLSGQSIIIITSENTYIHDLKTGATTLQSTTVPPSATPVPTVTPEVNPTSTPTVVPTVTPVISPVVGTMPLSVVETAVQTEIPPGVTPLINSNASTKEELKELQDQQFITTFAERFTNAKTTNDLEMMNSLYVAYKKLSKENQDLAFLIYSDTLSKICE